MKQSGEYVNCFGCLYCIASKTKCISTDGNGNKVCNFEPDGINDKPVFKGRKKDAKRVSLRDGLAAQRSHYGVGGPDDRHGG